MNTYATTGICYWPTQGETARGRFWYTPFNKEAFPNLNDEPDCSSDDFGITKFFNNKKVQSQLHVDTTITWATCKGIDYHKGLTTIPLFE